jgi:hypothetical protein
MARSLKKAQNLIEISLIQHNLYRLKTKSKLVLLVVVGGEVDEGRGTHTCCAKEGTFAGCAYCGGGGAYYGGVGGGGSQTSWPSHAAVVARAAAAVVAVAAMLCAPPPWLRAG